MAHNDSSERLGDVADLDIPQTSSNEDQDDLPTGQTNSNGTQNRLNHDTYASVYSTYLTQAMDTPNIRDIFNIVDTGTTSALSEVQTGLFNQGTAPQILYGMDRGEQELKEKKTPLLRKQKITRKSLTDIKKIVKSVLITEDHFILKFGKIRNKFGFRNKYRMHVYEDFDKLRIDGGKVKGKKGYIHPHISLDGMPCWGSIAEEIKELFINDIVGFVAVMKEFLMSFNSIGAFGPWREDLISEGTPQELETSDEFSIRLPQPCFAGLTGLTASANGNVGIGTEAPTLEENSVTAPDLSVPPSFAVTLVTSNLSLGRMFFGSYTVFDAFVYLDGYIFGLQEGYCSIRMYGNDIKYQTQDGSYLVANRDQIADISNHFLMIGGSRSRNWDWRTQKEYLIRYHLSGMMSIEFSGRLNVEHINLLNYYLGPYKIIGRRHDVDTREEIYEILLYRLGESIYVKRAEMYIEDRDLAESEIKRVIFNYTNGDVVTFKFNREQTEIDFRLSAEANIDLGGNRICFDGQRFLTMNIDLRDFPVTNCCVTS